MKNIRFGIDLGIGSVGWAVLSERDTTNNNTRCIIEDFGARIFDSSENSQNISKKQYKGLNNKNNKNQERRAFRAGRRLTRRKVQRRVCLNYVLAKLNIINYEDYKQWQEQNNPNIYKLRMEGLDNMLEGKQLAACLNHIAKNRGYRDFYNNAEEENLNVIDEEDEDNTKKPKKANKTRVDKESEDIKQAIKKFEELMISGNYRSPAEVFCKEKEFSNSNSDFPNVRNKAHKAQKYIINRDLLEKEANLILLKQSEFYPVLKNEIINGICKIIFDQRDFETGPGNEGEQHRKYKGFIDTLGECMFYKEETRGFRYTVIADLFAIINNLSQYKYINSTTGEIIRLPSQVAKEILNYIVINASISHRELDKLLQAKQIRYMKFETAEESLSKQNKFLKIIKIKLESAGYKYSDFAQEDHYNVNKQSRLQLLGEILSKNITPRRRKKALEELDYYKPELLNVVKDLKFSGTANVSNKYMLEAINAFRDGEIYGDFQARKLKERNEEDSKTIEKTKYLPPIDDTSIISNPVVFRAVNEARRVINALIRNYGSPTVINVEVASDVNRSFQSRQDIMNEQRKRQRINDEYKKQCAELFNISESEVSTVLIDKYKLYEEQGGKCLYSDEIIRKEDLNSYSYQIDHIVPYSLILDNTLNNKVLVLSQENQLKGQRVPLMYLEGDRRTKYINLINTLYSKKKEFIKKYNYLMLKSIHGEDAQNILSGWKSRNINDTRYISKYVIGYINKYLLFDSSREEKKNVYGIKGSITASYRRLWLNRESWAYSPDDIKKKEDAMNNVEKQIREQMKSNTPEVIEQAILDAKKNISKSLLGSLNIDNLSVKKNRENNLHHAIDAIIIANLSPAYVEIALDRSKLEEIAGRERNYHSVEYIDYLNNCISKMRNYYGFSDKKTYDLLHRDYNMPSSFLSDIRKEVDIRLNDDNYDLLRAETQEFYSDIPQLSDNIRMPLISAKVNHRFRGNIQGSENALKIKEVINDKGMTEGRLMKRIAIDSFTKDNAESLITGDDRLRELINNYYSMKKDISLNNHLIKYGYNINKLTIDSGKKDSYVIIHKKDRADNHTALCTKSYYCVEIYEDKEGNTAFRALRYIDIIKHNGKLYLNCPYPDNYGKHIMYLMKNDYIEASNKKKTKFIKGFYQSIFNANSGQVYVKLNNNNESKGITMTQFSIIKKYHIDPLGHIGGEIKCSELLLYPKVNG